MINLHPDLDPDKFVKRSNLPDLPSHIFDNYYKTANDYHINSKKRKSGFKWFVFVLVIAVITIYSKK